MRENTETPINVFHLQSQPPPPTFVDLAQLHNQPPAMVSTGLRLAFEDHQQQQMGLLLPSSTTLSSSLSEDLAPQIKQQRDEIDQILRTQVLFPISAFWVFHFSAFPATNPKKKKKIEKNRFMAQGEQLRRSLTERWRSHHRLLLAAAEASAARRLREMAAEAEKAAGRRAELEERVARLKAEAEAWEARAREQEEAAASLQAQLRQAMVVAGGCAQDKDGEQLGCTGLAEDAESAHVDPGRVVSGAPPCQVCRYRSVSALLLPCRHLCLCSACVTAVAACPICDCLRSGCVEVYFS